MTRIATTAVGLLCLFGCPVALAAASAAPDATSADAGAANTVPVDTRVVHFALSSLGVPGPIELHGVAASADIPFGLRGDEVVVGARLRLRLSYSPSMLAELSHVKVSLNGEPGGTIPLPKDTAGREIKSDVELNPDYVTDFNHLKLELIGHYTVECEDPHHSSLWATISERSELELTLRPLELRNDLALLPAPFFDRRDGRRLELPIVLPPATSAGVVWSAGVVASWFGALADYRSARFPVLQGDLPMRHALVFATNAVKPAGLELDDVAGPSLRIVDHPRDPHFKLLVIMGRDESELRQAALGLVVGHAVLTGAEAAIRSVSVTPRPPYDAPRWLRSDRPVRFGELIDRPDALETHGRRPDPIRIVLRIPPDLLTWNTNGVPIDLHYRFTAPVERDESSLTLEVNDRLARVMHLRPDPERTSVQRVLLPLLPGTTLAEGERLALPAIQVGIDNTLKLQFAFDSHAERACRERMADVARASIDPDSTIDLTGFQHYTALPNLALFANAGFPFTRHADLAETVIVLPEQADAASLEELFFMLGRFGRLTGAAATAYRLASGTTATAEFADADVLLLGAASPSRAQGRLGRQLALELDRNERRFHVPVLAAGFVAPNPLRPEPERAHADAQVAVQAAGSLGAIAGFESPLTAGRSVVALLGADPATAAAILDAFEDPARMAAMRGDFVLIRGADVQSYQDGGRYYTGSLPWLTRLWFHLSLHPLLLMLGALAIAVVIAFIVYGRLQRRARRRLHGANE